MSEKKSEDVLVPATTEDQTPVSKTTKKNAISTKSKKNVTLKELTRIEERIKEGTIKYFETGMLLLRIRKEKLYKLRGYSTFQDYCEKVFNFSRSYGYRLVAYSRVWDLLGDDVKSEIPERLIRPLANLKPEIVTDIWEKAKANAGGAMPSCKQLEELVKDYRFQSIENKLTEKFGSCSEESFFSHVLRRKIQTATTATELIDNSKTREMLISAVKELKSLNINLNPHEKEELKAEILRRQEQELEEYL